VLEASPIDAVDDEQLAMRIGRVPFIDSCRDADPSLSANQIWLIGFRRPMKPGSSQALARL